MLVALDLFRDRFATQLSDDIGLQFVGEKCLLIERSKTLIFRSRDQSEIITTMIGDDDRSPVGFSAESSEFSLKLLRCDFGHVGSPFCKKTQFTNYSDNTRIAIRTYS